MNEKELAKAATEGRENFVSQEDNDGNIILTSIEYGSSIKLVLMTPKSKEAWDKVKEDDKVMSDEEFWSTLD